MNTTFCISPKKLLAGLLTSSFCMTSFSVDALNFSDAYQTLVKNDYSYQRALLDFEADKTLVPQARADLLPNLSLSGSTGYVRNDIQRLEDSEDEENTQIVEDDDEDLDLDGETRRREEYAFRLLQPIYNRTLSSRFKQAKSRLLESELRLQRVLEQQLQTLADNYFGYMNAAANMEIAKRELQSVNDHRLLTIERQKIGLGTMADVHEAVSRYKVAEVELLEDVKSRDLFADRLRRLLQLNHEAIDVKALKFDELEVQPKTANVQRLVDDNVESNIEVELQRRLIESAKLAVRLDKAEHLPTVDLTASSGRSETEALEVGDERSTRDDRVMLEVNIPLFSGFGKRAKVRESRFRLAAEQVELKNILAVQSEVIAEAYRSKQTAYKKMRALEESFSSSDQALLLRQEGYLEGIVISLDVLNAFRDKHRAERSWKAASFEYLGEIVRLNIALGKVDFADFGQIDKFLMNFDENDGGIQRAQQTTGPKDLVDIQTLNEKELRDFIFLWERSWEKGDVGEYFSFYSSSFQPNKLHSYHDWKRSRQEKVVSEKQINLEIKDFSVRKLASEQNRYEVQFWQNYNSKNFSDASMKILLIEKVDGALKIYSEKSI